MITHSFTPDNQPLNRSQFFMDHLTEFSTDCREDDPRKKIQQRWENHIKKLGLKWNPATELQEHCRVCHGLPWIQSMWLWINTYTIFSGMNIHKSQLFWGSPGVPWVLTHCHVKIHLCRRLPWCRSIQDGSRRRMSVRIATPLGRAGMIRVADGGAWLLRDARPRSRRRLHLGGAGAGISPSDTLW